jgi:hypothetical protein
MDARITEIKFPLNFLLITSQTQVRNRFFQLARQIGKMILKGLT